jgi:hypothetical protein
MLRSIPGRISYITSDLMSTNLGFKAKLFSYMYHHLKGTGGMGSLRM